MPISLRTRLFLTVAAVLATAIAVSALLSRRATLVEVKEVVASVPQPLSPALVERVMSHVRSAGTTGLGPVLADIQRDTGRRLLLVDPAGPTAIAASSPMLERARIVRASVDGTLVAEVGSGAGLSVLEVRGAAPHRGQDADGNVVLLYALPKADLPGADVEPAGIPVWIVTTGVTALIALALTYTLSRRVLEPVTALTRAARRLEAGDLSVRVAAAEARGDEIGELERAFDQMAARLSETERLRRQMVSDVAHELRSPVTNLRCTLEAVQDGLMAPDATAIAGLYEETLFLQRLIADLQDLALAEADRLDLRRQPVDVAAIVRRACVPFAAVPGAPISVRVAGQAATILGDEARLEQVFRNLLSNARRHTPAEGRIDVAVAGEGGGVRVAVSDTGDGIVPAHLTHVFDRFYRTDESRSRATGGAGLGLAIVRQLVEAHGGRIEAESPGAGRGSTFTIVLPAGAGVRA